MRWSLPLYGVIPEVASLFRWSNIWRGAITKVLSSLCSYRGEEVIPEEESFLRCGHPCSGIFPENESVMERSHPWNGSFSEEASFLSRKHPEKESSLRRIHPWRGVTRKEEVFLRRSQPWSGMNHPWGAVIPLVESSLKRSPLWAGIIRELLASLRLKQPCYRHVWAGAVTAVVSLYSTSKRRRLHRNRPKQSEG